MKYTTYGHVRGLCGHRHKTALAAEQCLARDRAGCAAHGGYSDRDAYAIGADGYLIYHGSPVWPSHGRSTGAVRAP